MEIKENLKNELLFRMFGSKPDPRLQRDFVKEQEVLLESLRDEIVSIKKNLKDLTNKEDYQEFLKELLDIRNISLVREEITLELIKGEVENV